MSESRKHTGRLDDDLERRVEGHLRGASLTGGRAEDFREPEPPLEGEPEVSAVPEGDDHSRSDVPLDMTPREVDARSRFARYVARTRYPATKEDLLRNAREAKAPDDILADLQRLPEGERFESVARAWAALGGTMERRF